MNFLSNSWYGILVLFLIVLTLGACGSLPTDEASKANAANANVLKSGDPNAQSKSLDITPMTTGSYMGDAEQSHTNAESAVTSTNSQSGTVQTGWQFAGVSNVNAAVAERIKEDPVLRVLQMQAERLSLAEPVDELAVTDNANRMAARVKEIETSIAKAGGDVSGLRELHQVFTNISLNGAKGDVSEDQARSMAAAIPEAIRAANGTPKTSEPRVPLQPTGDGN